MSSGLIPGLDLVQERFAALSNDLRSEYPKLHGDWKRSNTIKVVELSTTLFLVDRVEDCAAVKFLCFRFCRLSTSSAKVLPFCRFWLAIAFHSHEQL